MHASGHFTGRQAGTLQADLAVGHWGSLQKVRTLGQSLAMPSG